MCRKTNCLCFTLLVELVVVCCCCFNLVCCGQLLLCLESQFGEEPFVFARLVLLFEFHSCLEAMHLAFGRIFEIFHGYLIELHIRNTVSGWHHVIVVQKLQNTEKEQNEW